jgi:hypothetical protein
MLAMRKPHHLIGGDRGPVAKCVDYGELVVRASTGMAGATG